jgi:hypothetical protein
VSCLPPHDLKCLGLTRRQPYVCIKCSVFVYGIWQKKKAALWETLGRLRIQIHYYCCGRYSWIILSIRKKFESLVEKYNACTSLIQTNIHFCVPGVDMYIFCRSKDVQRGGFTHRFSLGCTKTI